MGFLSNIIDKVEDSVNNAGDKVGDALNQFGAWREEARQDRKERKDAKFDLKIGERETELQAKQAIIQASQASNDSATIFTYAFVSVVIIAAVLIYRKIKA